MSKRRKFVSLILALLVVGWFLWPRADARFVGRWTLQGPADQRPTDDIEFRRSGIALVREVDTGQSLYYLRWRVDGDLLMLGEKGSPGHVAIAVAQLWDWVSDTPVVTNEHVPFKIAEVGADAILLRGPGSGAESRLTRKK
ncbi:hypothetical protein Pan44_47670 [Caulifigura coniformis]|uniref:Lipocalin-like domain-containing protein n=1 Tax=Caulifigura coniformis TaxID=2527983 RepID=A0A517SKS1_9PLAN|nr:hypothetical protein [Caulifigura coniformis]QDT56710.1 hypothetical protein Pan44_47670 [Caulifigura coniformis]